ncbi:hypothetical protein MNBD_GAMMA15-458 [hydrothermal vent metagenome]|uniref:DUF3592 domain-containing protein n=1 Tax=hydrothermal vent metagenome TaxID=652676 RepID=A0A3B0YM27_9ZZZZ
MTETTKIESTSGTVIIILVVLAFVAYVLYNTYGVPVQKTEHEKRLLDTGVLAPARVVSILPGGGKTDGANIEARRKLEVRPEGKAAFTVDVTAFVLIRKLADFVPGAEITVRYDPQNPSDVVIVQ